MDIPGCESCKIQFLGSDSVFAASCGHLFHETCLDYILARKPKCCPQCNNLCLSSQSMRVYLPFPQETSERDKLLTEYKMLKHELVETENDFASDAAILSNLEASIDVKNAALEQRDKKAAEMKLLIKEKEKLQKKIKKLEKFCAVQKAFAGTPMETNQILNQKQPADTLATIAVSLTSETKRIQAEKQEIRSEMREHRKENIALAKNYRNYRTKFEISVARNIKKSSQN